MRTPRPASALLRQADEALAEARWMAALDLSARAVEAADRLPEGTDRSHARRLHAEALYWADRDDDAARMANEAMRVAHAARSPGEEALATVMLVVVLSARCDFVEALRQANRATVLAERAEDPATLRTALAEQALVRSRLGDGQGAREAFAQAFAIPPGDQPSQWELRGLLNVASADAAAGRFAAALDALARGEALAAARGVEASWTIAHARIHVLVDLGAIDEARDALSIVAAPTDGPAWQRGQELALRATVAHAAGERPDVVERLAEAGLALPGLDFATRTSLDRMRALAVFARGRNEEAERLAVELTSASARGGGRAQGAEALALAARAGNPEAWLLRWLGTLALATDGAATRVEHEAFAALVGEPDPIGAYGRMYVGIKRTRLVESAPPEYRVTLKRTLRQVEARLVALRQARRTEVGTTLEDVVLRAKEEVGLAGSSPLLLRAVATLARAAKSDASLVLTGETGSGKELFARLSHRLSRRVVGPFVAVNCAAIPEPLLEAELFGHERGAFTGAERARRGLFVEAEGGTLFLDEVGEMSPAMQAKLLRVLEDREVRAIGGTRSRKVDVRVVAATHRDLTKLVAANKFREDLFYRLAAITVGVPSLRERPEDIPAIARALLAREPSTQKHRLDLPALTIISEHTWPGNVRELANVLLVSAAMAEGKVIGQPELAEAMTTRGKAHGGPDARNVEETTLASLRGRHRAELRELVGRAIAAADGNKLRAARALGISRQGLYRVLDE